MALQPFLNSDNTATQLEQAQYPDYLIRKLEDALARQAFVPFTELANFDYQRIEEIPYRQEQYLNSSQRRRDRVRYGMYDNSEDSSSSEDEVVYPSLTLSLPQLESDESLNRRFAEWNARRLAACQPFINRIQQITGRIRPTSQWSKVFPALIKLATFRFHEQEPENRNDWRAQRAWNQRRINARNNIVQEVRQSAKCIKNSQLDYDCSIDLENYSELKAVLETK